MERGDTTQLGRFLFPSVIILGGFVSFGSLVNWEVINVAGCSSDIEHLATWAVWMLQTELDHVVPDGVLRTLKLKQLAETLVLINGYVFVFVRSASQSLLPLARNLSIVTCCLKTFKTAEKGLLPFFSKAK